MGRLTDAVKVGWKIFRNKERREQLLAVLNNPAMQNRILSNYQTADNKMDYIFPEIKDIITLYPDLKKLKIALVGGCEFEYAQQLLQEAGLVSYHTFTDLGATNAYLELNSENSKIWEYKPDVVLFSVSDLIRKQLKDIQENSATIDSQEAAIKEVKDFTAACAKIIKEKLNCNAFVATYDLLFRPAAGAVDYKRNTNQYSLSEFTRRFELSLYELQRETPNLYILDLSNIFAIPGKLNTLQLFEDNAYWTHYNRDGAKYLVTQMLKSLIAINGTGKRIKCVAVDLDNTLWEGILPG